MSVENTTEKLVDDIDTVVWNASNQIDAVDERQFIRNQIPTAMWLLLAVPVLAVIIQCLRWAGGFGPSQIFSLMTWAILACAVPAIWMVFRIANRPKTVSRTQALRETDQILGSCERIVTADHFLQQELRDGFMQAAVDDASDWAQRGCDARLQQTGSESSNIAGVYWPIPVAIACLILAAFLAPFTRAQLTADASSDAQSNRFAETVIAAPQVATNNPTVNEQQPPAKPPESARDPRSQPSVNRQGSANAAIPDSAEMSQGKLNEGTTRESQQSANPSSASGAPSASGQPSKSGDETKRKPKKKQKPKPEKKRDSKPKKEDEKPSGSTAGQGSSKGSDNNAAPSDWASMSQAATPEDDDSDEEDEVDDEEEEQESRGGVQPNMRDRRPPVNRDLQIGFGNARPNPDANGRGGPSGQKKSRGVASLVLGVPIPDRVNGQPNKGRIRITQQRITPEAEQSDAVAAEDRTARQGPVGPIADPDFSPWLHDLVRRYFLQRRAKHPLKTKPQESTPVTAPNGPLGTTSIVESETPQS